MSEADLPPWKRAAASLAVAALTAACFWPALRNGLLIWDDAGYIWENEAIATFGRATVDWAFSTHHGDVWIPLTWLSLALDRAVWGLDATGYHLTNVLLHALDAGLFFLLALALLRRVPGPAPDPAGGAARARRDLAGAFLAALLWSLHPLRVESVAWAAERKDVLSLLFGLLAALAFLRHAAPGARAAAAVEREGGAAVQHRAGPIPLPAAGPWYWTALGCFVLALLAKASLVVLPLLLLVLDWWPLGRWRGRGAGWLLQEKAPFLGVALVLGQVSLDAAAPNTTPFSQIGLPARLVVAVQSTAAYLGLTLWPADVSPFYQHPGDQAELGAAGWLGLALVLGLSAAAAATARRWPWLLATWLAFLLPLLPFLGFTQVGPQAMAARFTQVAALPLSLLAGAGLARAAQAAGRASPWAAALPLVAGALAAMALGQVTVRDLAAWKDDVTLWTRVIELAPHGAWRAHLERSNGWLRRGEPGPALADIDRALALAAAGRAPAVHELHVARARILKSTGRTEEALEAYGQAVAAASGGDRTWVLLERGGFYRELGRDSLAARDFSAASAGPRPTR